MRAGGQVVQRQWSLTLCLAQFTVDSHPLTLIPFPPLVPLPRKIKERPPIKKMIISLKINDPLVTKVGNVHLPSLSENAIGQMAHPDAKNEKQNMANKRRAVQCVLPTNSSAMSTGEGRDGWATREKATKRAARPRERVMRDAEGEGSHKLLRRTQGKCNCPPGSLGPPLPPTST